MSTDRGLDWMMWRIENHQQDDPPLVNLIRAMQYFSDKYGGVPNRCETPIGWADGLESPPGMEVVEVANLPVHHLRLAFDRRMGGRGFHPRKESETDA
jgi:hypothetical protein